MYIFQVSIFRHNQFHRKYVVSAENDSVAREEAIKVDNLVGVGGGAWGTGMEINFCDIKMIRKLDNV